MTNKFIWMINRLSNFAFIKVYRQFSDNIQTWWSFTNDFKCNSSFYSFWSQDDAELYHPFDFLSITYYHHANVYFSVLFELLCSAAHAFRFLGLLVCVFLVKIIKKKQSLFFSYSQTSTYLGVRADLTLWSRLTNIAVGIKIS